MGGIIWDETVVHKTAFKEHNYNEKIQVGVFSSFTKLPVYFIVSKLSQCIIAFCGCTLILSYGASAGLVAEMINWGIVCVCVCVCVCVFASESLCFSICLFVCLSSSSSDTKPYSVLS